MDTGFGRTRGTGKDGEYYVCFSYLEEDAGVYAAKAAVAIARALADGQPYEMAEDIMRLKEIREDTRLGPSTGCIVEEAVSYTHLDVYKRQVVHRVYLPIGAGL